MSMWKNWIFSLIAASVISALAERLTPGGGVKKVTGFVCGVMLLAVMLSPAISPDREAYSLALADLRDMTDRLTRETEDREKQLLRTYIRERTEAYILDEAERIGLQDLRIGLKLEWRDECWVPWEIDLYCPENEAPAELTRFLDAELGIPPERQHWNE